VRAVDGPFVILGGGPCGLSAAWTLARAGKKPIVLEREPLVGGLCATHVKEGWRFDLGGHRFVSASAELSSWLERLLGDDLLTRERRSVVLHDGRAFKYPLDARDLLANLGVRENARALAGYARSRAVRALRPSPDVTFEEWVTARFGRPLYDTFFGPYTAKLWGIAPSAISADWAAERIGLLHLGDALLRMAGLARGEIRTYARRYRYPRLGMGQLYAAMAKEIRTHGGEILTGARVAGLEVKGGRVTAVQLVGEGGPRRIPAGEVLSTIPLPELVRALSPERSPAEGARLRFRALTFLNVMLARRDFSENTWMYVASPALSMSRIQEPKRRSPWMAPQGRTSIMLEIPCDVGDEVWRAPVSELLARAERELARLGFHANDALGAFAVRVEHGYPVYHLGYERDRRALLSEVARFSNVRTAGRQGLFRYVFMDAAMEMGAVAARQMMGGEDALRGAARIDAIGRATRPVESLALTA
jgi:protoporphyrinogen oxidase